MAVELKKYISKKGKDIPHLYIDQNGFFWVRKRIGDVTPRKKLDTNVESVAVAKIFQTLRQLEIETEAKQKTADEKKEIELNPDKSLLFSDFWEKMRDEKSTIKSVRPATLLRIDSIGKHSILPWWGNKKPSEITVDSGLEFIKWHNENRIDPKTNKPMQLVNVFKYLTPVFKMMIEREVLSPKNKPKLELPLTEKRHHKSPKGKVITFEDYLRIERVYDERYVLMLKLAHDLGMRQMEIGKLECTSVKKIDGRVCIDLSHEETKTGIPRIIPIPELYADDLWAAKKRNKTFIFEAPTDLNRHISAKLIFQQFKTAKKRAGYSGKLRFHDLRDTAATNMVRAKLNPVVIATFLGMSIKVLQEKYLKLSVKDLLIVTDAMVNLRLQGSQK